MHIGILSARSPEYHPNRRLIEAASGLGHKVTIIHPKDCLGEIRQGGQDLEAPQRGDLDVLLPRIGSTINEYALALVRHFELARIPVVNGFESILLARNKALCLQTLSRMGIPVPHSYLVSNFKTFQRAVDRLGGYPVVAKVLSSRQGKGVLLVESPLTAEFIIDKYHQKRECLLVQEFIPPEKRRDLRAIVLGDEVSGAMTLTPKAGDFRSNIHLTGQGKEAHLDRAFTGLAVGSGRALGLDISGVDMLVDAQGVAKVIEVNYSPGFKGLEAATGLDMGARMIQYIARTSGERS